MIDGCINNTITDGLSNDLLGLFDALQAELLGNVGKRDLGVADVDLLQTKLDDSVFETMDQGQDSINFEHVRKALHVRIEPIHVTLLHKVHDLVVGVEVLREVLLVEDLSVRNLTHEKLNDDEQLLSVDAEAHGADLWSLPQRLDQRSLSLGVLELHGLDAALVVQISGVLVV